MGEYKPTVVFDFDGVIHSYKSGWKGADVIPDPVVPGIKEAIDELRSDGYTVIVVSTRCSNYAGTCAVKEYLEKNGITVDMVCAEKPPAVCYVDDRALRFDGNAATLVRQIKGFHSWTEGKPRSPVVGMRPCKAGVFRKGEITEITGVFHGWGSDFEEFEAGPGNFMIALVETDDGRVFECPASTVMFLDREVPLP